MAKWDLSKLEKKQKEEAEDLKKYPTSTKLLIDKLTKNSFWQDLNVSDVQKVILWSHYSLIEVSHNDLLYGDKFLLNEDDDYVVSITG